MSTTEDMRTVLVTGSDAGYFPLLRDCLSSLVALSPGDVALAVLDFGLTDEQREWVTSIDAHLIAPKLPADFADLPEGKHPSHNMGLLTRLFLTDYFPGFDRYVWIDADAWLQRWDVIGRLMAGADAHGLAIVHEYDSSYRVQPELLAWTAKHYVQGYGALAGTRLIVRRRKVNAGVFAMHRDAPQWEPWRRAVAAAIRRTGNVMPHDQFALNRLVAIDKIPVELLPPVNNWICGRRVPMWDPAESAFCTPHEDHEVISVMHLAGAAAKSETFDISALDGRTISTGLRFSQRPSVTESPS